MKKDVRNCDGQLRNDSENGFLRIGHQEGQACCRVCGWVESLTPRNDRRMVIGTESWVVDEGTMG